MTNENEELEFETPLEEEIDSLDIPIGKRTVYTESADPEVDSLFNKSKRGKLVVQPDPRPPCCNERRQNGISASSEARDLK